MDAKDQSIKEGEAERIRLNQESTFKRIIPYHSREELASRVRNNLDWYGVEDFTAGRPYLLQDEGSCHADHYPGTDLTDIVQYLPEDHEVVKEILSHVKISLEAVAEKSSSELELRVPRFLNAFLVAEWGHRYPCLFDKVSVAAYHVLETYPVIKDSRPPMKRYPYTEYPPREAEIVAAAVKGMAGFSKTHPLKIRLFLDQAWEKRAALPFVLTQRAMLGDEQAIEHYFALVEESRGENKFVLDDCIKRECDFEYIGRRVLKRQFPNYYFLKRIEAVQDSWARLHTRDCVTFDSLDAILREKLRRIFE